MCGIVGAWLTGGLSAEALRGSLNAIRHRGPDDSGGFRDGSVGLGMRPLAAASGLSLSVRPQGIYDYLSLCVVPQPETIYEGVYTLAPGSWLKFDGKSSVTRSYWRLNYTYKERMPYAEAVVRTREL